MDVFFFRVPPGGQLLNVSLFSRAVTVFILLCLFSSISDMIKFPYWGIVLFNHAN